MIILKKKSMKNKCENCGECCLRTEMTLSNKDVDRIVKISNHNLKRKDFVFINKDRFFQLKNSKDHCVFLDSFSKLCNIYENRPLGCRFYPLIYDSQQKKCIFDIDCPRPYLFYQNKIDLEKTCENLMSFLKNELDIRLK
jgi:Fe-S-cluster containining protein